MRIQPRHGLFDQVQNAVEIPGVVRVRHMVGTDMGGEIGQQADRGVVAVRAQIFDVRDVFCVHSDDQVEVVEILGHELARA